PPPLAEPKDKGKIVILSKPAPIKAGELLGYIGQFQEEGFVESPSKTTKPPFEPLLHFECFTPDDLPAFIQQGQENEAQRPAQEKTLLLVEKNTLLHQPAAADDFIKAGQHFKVSQLSGHWAEVALSFVVTVENRRKDLGTYSKPTYSIS